MLRFAFQHEVSSVQKDRLGVGLLNCLLQQIIPGAEERQLSTPTRPSSIANPWSWQEYFQPVGENHDQRDRSLRVSARIPEDHEQPAEEDVDN